MPRRILVEQNVSARPALPALPARKFPAPQKTPRTNIKRQYELTRTPIVSINTKIVAASSRKGCHLPATNNMNLTIS